MTDGRVWRTALAGVAAIGLALPAAGAATAAPSAAMHRARPAAGPGGPAGGARRPAGGVRRAPLVVRTTKGRVRGFYHRAAREFLGIPYAASTAGAWRWRPPRPHRPWHGIRPATAAGPLCAQTGSLATGVPSSSTALNCLSLNIYSPRRLASRRALPVMVWIHGGGFTGGAGSIYDGAVLAAKGHVIVVTINYRLNAFGFLALPSLDKESRYHTSGDYGLMDQQAALRWVRRNARAFGGDPHNVTIFGESAGGASVCMNMASPTARGLFERAIAESGCLFPAPTLRQAERQGTALAASLGCTRPASAAACLRGKSVAAILKAEGSMGWSPVIGSPALPQSPVTAFATGQYAHVRLLQGTNHDEGRLFVGLDFDLAQGHPLTSRRYPKVVAAQFGTTDAAKILAHYSLSHYTSPDLAYAAVLTDAQFSCPALFADEFTQRTGTYAYEFSDPHPPNNFGVHFSFPLGAAHSTELQYVFQRIPLLDRLPPFSPGQLRLSNLMIGYWSRFAATGSPNGGSGPHWPRFTGKAPAIQELVPDATTPEPASSFAAFHHCAFWASIEA